MYALSSRNIFNTLQGNVLWPHAFTLLNRLYFISQYIILYLQFSLTKELKLCKEKTYLITCLYLPSILAFTNVIFWFDVTVKGNTSGFGSAIQVLPSHLEN